MKQLGLVAGCALVGFLAWFMASHLSSDALGMGVGVLFGMLAGIPSALLVLASGRVRNRHEDDDYEDIRREAAAYYERIGQPFPYQPPVIVLAAPREQQPQTVNNTYNNTYNDNRQVHVGSSMPLIEDRQREVQAQRSGRVFRVVGEREEWGE